MADHSLKYYYLYIVCLKLARTERNGERTYNFNTSIWLWIFLPSSSFLYAAQQTFGSASVAVSVAASESQHPSSTVETQ